MKRLFALSVIILAIAMTFSSCDSESLILPADSLLSPPLYYEEYEELVNLFYNSIKDETTLCIPQKGDYRSAIIVEDFDSDGNPEAVIFYKNNNDVSVARMHYFDSVDGRWISFGDYNGYGAGIENIIISDMDIDGNSEILVLWNTSGSPSGNILSIYRLDVVTKKYKEILNESCFLSEVIDIDGNGRKDIFLISQNNIQSGNQKVAKTMRLSGDSFILFGETKLDPNISTYSSVKTEKASKDSPMRIYVDALKGEHEMITEVIYWDHSLSKLCSPLLDTETMTNFATLRYEPVGCSDINNDGIIDIPVQSSVFGKGDNLITVDTENIYLTEWKNLNSSGLETVAYTLVNYSDGYMIKLDESEIYSTGIRSYRSQNCWIVYSADSDGEAVNELFSVIKIPFLKWNVQKFSAYIPVIENEESIVCAFVTSDGKKLGLDEKFIKSKIIKIS
ncbi:MAG: hypothetical protein IKJ41_12395 [Clostridia bacterium]|nr:hypothetical protein [Clostridia bacterium]